ncbi:DUF5723 family protein [Plebeiibacterium sediminum]|uniref:DUF5723 family protein n=1 Tax=Plebeiibacterium sediminum TaxID=2992112 RepID=A0AAE3M1C6_9BACT|nr:DUF5723 family protein [Plebeiobacterium sediminum]MCW3785106.1 DUF5723 family protein [Plebeiobacterium sediminum]
MHKIIVLILLLLALTTAKAQQNNTLFLMHELPQANIVNPSVPINCKWLIGKPMLGSTHINGYSTGFSFNDVFENFDGDSLRFNPDKTLHKFNKLELLATEFHLSLISLGYKYKQNYFTFYINEKINTYHTLSKNAFILANEGNTQFEGQNTQMDGTRINAVHYREYAIGWAREVNDDLDIGIRAKLLFGKANIYTKYSNMRLYTNPVSYALNLVASGELYSSFPLEVTPNEEGYVDDIEDIETKDINTTDYLLNRQNKGFGIDLGLTYRLDELTTLSASILDIGFIKWNSEVNQFHSSGQMDITGETYSQGLDDYETIKDTLYNAFNPYLYNSAYTSPLVPTFYAGIERIIPNTLDIGAVFHSEFYKKRWHPSLSISANKQFGKILSTGISYTLQNKQINNLGIGLGVKLGPVHLHALSDNIPAFFNLANTRNVNLRFGISFLGGCKETQIRNKGKGALPCFGDPYNAVKSTKRK